MSTHYRNFAGEIVRVRFANCHVEDLNNAERTLIADLDAKPDTNLRNRLITRRPVGIAPLEFTIEQGRTVPLPWNRADRGRLDPTSTVDLSSVTEAALAKYREISAFEHYDILCWLVRTFVDAIVPSPTLTAPLLWTISAMPSTAKSRISHRFLTVNAGILETLRVVENKDGDELLYIAELNISSADPATSRRVRGRVEQLDGPRPQPLAAQPQRAVFRRRGQRSSSDLGVGTPRLRS